MKPSPLAASVSGFLGVFQKPLGLPDTWEWPLLILVFVFLIPLLFLQRRRRTVRLAAALPALENPPSRRRSRLFLGVILAASASGPLWLHYTGVDLPISS